MNPDTIDAMLAAGASAEIIAAAWKSELIAQGKAAEHRRAKDRVRQQRRRSRGVTRTSCDAPLNESILNPPDSPKPDGLAPAQKSKSVRGTRLPDNWRLPDEWRQWASERRGWTDGEIDEEAEVFANYWQAKSGAGACHVNWAKTWKNWAIRSHRADGFKAPSKPREPLTTEQLHSAIRFRRDIGDEERAKQLEAELAERLAA